VTTTVGWAAAKRCAGGALIDLIDRPGVALDAWTARDLRGGQVPSRLQRVLCDWAGHAAGQQDGKKEAENVDSVKVHLG
jgi:hypothetical protein